MPQKTPRFLIHRYRPAIAFGPRRRTCTGGPNPRTAGAYLRKQAQQKEDARTAGGVGDYKNVADSFSYFDITGSPALSYFATFNQGDQVMTEYFIRVLGPKGYAMFFTTGKLEDVKAIMPQVKQMASSLRGP